MRFINDRRRLLSFVLFAVYLLALSWLVLLKLQFAIPAPEEGRVLNLNLLAGFKYNVGASHLSEIRNNVIAFLPMGIYVCLIWYKKPFIHRLSAIALLSVCYETIQFICAIGVADITDVLSNTLGGLIGMGMYALLHRFLKERTDGIICVVAAIFTAAALLIIAYLLATHRWIRIQ